MNYTTLGQIYNSVKKYFEKGSLEDFMVLLGILVAKNHSCFSDFESVPKDEQRVIDKRTYDTLRAFWRVIKKDPKQWNKYSFAELRDNLLDKVICKIKDADKVKIVSIFTGFSINAEGIVSIDRPQAEKRDIMEDFSFVEETVKEPAPTQAPAPAASAPTTATAPAPEPVQTPVSVQTPAPEPVQIPVQVQTPALAPAHTPVSTPVTAPITSTHITDLIWSSWKDVYRNNDSYYWSWRLTKEQYESLRSFLKKALRGKEREKILRYSDYLSLYCAELYKREFNGRDNKGRGFVFRSIGIENDANLPRYLVERVSRINLRGRNRYLYSLYIQGGLPWRYIIQKDGTNLARNIAKLFKASNENGADVATIAQEINNTAIRESILDRGSIFENLACILEDESYVDYIQSQFPDYDTQIYNFVHAIRKEVNRNFSLVWRFDRRHCNYLVPMLCFTSATENGIIPSSLLSTCGVDLTKCTRFNLVVRSYNSAGAEIGAKEWTYYRCANPAYFSSSENFDGRVIDRYKSADEIPHAFKVFIEDVPGPFGIKMDNGFDNAKNEPVHVFDSLDIIKFYGENDQQLLYSNPKDAQLYLLNREFIHTNGDHQVISAGEFEFIPVYGPITVHVRGKEIRLSPYGLMEIFLSSESLAGVLDESCASNVVDDRYYADIKYKDITIKDVLLISHQDLADMMVTIGGDEMKPGTYTVEYVDGEGNPIDQIESHFGLTIIKASCEKYAEQRVYLVDAERNLDRKVIIVNGAEHQCSYTYQPENSMEITIGDQSSGEFKCLIYYPFKLKDIILTYPVRRVYRSQRFYETSKSFYYCRQFDEDGCEEYPYKAQTYSKSRNEIIHINEGTFGLRKPSGEALPAPTEFYFYNISTKKLMQATEYTYIDEIPRLVVPDDFRRQVDPCLVFQSLKNPTADTEYRCHAARRLPTFDAELWNVIHEHRLHLEDFWGNNEEQTCELLKSYYKFTEYNPDYEFLKNIAKAKGFSWLLLGCKRLWNIFGNKEMILKLIKETSPCKNAPNFNLFAELFVANIKYINYKGEIKKSTGTGKCAALALSGADTIWKLDDEQRVKICNYLAKEMSYKKLIETLKLK